MARFSGAAFRLVERRMTASLVAAGVCLTLLLPGDVLWINDEPALILLAMEANRAGVPASAGLPGTVGICYGPLAVWFYQLLLFCTAHPILLVTIKSTLVMLVSLAAIQRLGKELRFDWRLFGALFLLNPFLWHANRILWDNVLLLPLVCWLFALLPAYWRRGSPRTLAGIVALLGGMFWLHPMSAPLIGAFGITLLFRPDLLRRDRWKLAAAGLALLLVVGAILLHAEFGRQGIPPGEGAGIEPLWNLLLFLSGGGYLRYYLPEYLPSGSGVDVLFRIVTPPAAVAAGGADAARMPVRMDAPPHRPDPHGRTLRHGGAGASFRHGVSAADAPVSALQHGGGGSGAAADVFRIFRDEAVPAARGADCRTGSAAVHRKRPSDDPPARRKPFDPVRRDAGQPVGGGAGGRGGGPRRRRDPRNRRAELPAVSACIARIAVAGATGASVAGASGRSSLADRPDHLPFHIGAGGISRGSLHRQESAVNSSVPLPAAVFSSRKWRIMPLGAA
ncbi:MAG: hypothetical protein L6W00_13360 [Lentisphaeria bacterium]|nr:MAG: hypothetical protein L6W00_13360 [Lentisphaeria bacterium]